MDNRLNQYLRVSEPIEYIRDIDVSPLDNSPKMKGKRVDVRTEPKIGRNEPCHCDSGKKYKKCCLKLDNAR